MPDGGNEVFMGGSAQWIKLQKMYYLTTWASTHVAYVYQNPIDFPATMQKYLCDLAAKL